MIRVIYPDSPPRRLPFYLAMEEYVAHSLPAKKPDGSRCDYFFMWQVDPTVIFGRNQVIENEVNIDYCRENAIEFYRRKSGGGCVFANRDNIMFSYITSGRSTVESTFSEYTSLIARLLSSLGLYTEPSSRNDILIAGRKVSGNAFYHLHGRSIVHGTMLFDTDRTRMSSAITPSRQKLQAKGVESVRSRVTTIREHLDISIDRFKDYVLSALCDSEVTLTSADIREIELIEQTYYDPQWIYRKSTHTATADHSSKTIRIEGAGDFQIAVDTDTSGNISSIDLSGDYFPLADVESQLISPLIATPCNREALTETLAGVDASRIILGLSTNDFINLLSR